MPQSKSRHPHHKHAHHPQRQNNQSPVIQQKTAKTNRAVVATIIFCTVLGFLVSLFIDASSIFVIAIGTIAGAAAGFLLGEQIKKSLTTK